MGWGGEDPVEAPHGTCLQIEMWQTLRRGRKIEAQEKAARQGSCRLRPGPVQDCFLRSRPGYCNALCNLTAGVGVWGYFVKGLERCLGRGGLRGDGLHLLLLTPLFPPALHPGFGEAEREAGAPGKGLEIREARGSIPPPRWGRGAGAAGGAGNAALWGGVSISAAQQAGEGGCLGEGPGWAAEGRGCGCCRGARSPLLARHDCGTWCREEGQPPGAARGCSHWCRNPSRSRSSRCLLLLLCGGNRCTQTESSCEQGAGRGLKGEPRVQTSAAPGGRGQVPRKHGRLSVQPGTQRFQVCFLVRGNVNQRWFSSTDHFEASISLRANDRESFLLKGKLNHSFLQ